MISWCRSAARTWRLKCKQRYIPRLIACMAYCLLKALSATCRFRYQGLDNFKSATKSERGCLMVLWHSRLAVLPELLARINDEQSYTALISYSRDGEIISWLTERYRGATVMRVRHDGRGEALRTLIEKMKRGDENVIITPDGPKGPAERVKPGLLVAARESSAPVLPMSWRASRAWRLPTWDGMLLPKPFSTVDVVFGRPFTLEGDKESEGERCSEREMLQGDAERVEAAMGRLLG